MRRLDSNGGRLQRTFALKNPNVGLGEVDMVLHAKFRSCVFIQSMSYQVILQGETLPRTIVKFDAKQESAAPTVGYGRRLKQCAHNQQWARYVEPFIGWASNMGALRPNQRYVAG